MNQSIAPGASTPISVPQRQFLPTSFQLTDWISLKPYLDDLQKRSLPDLPSLEHWLRDWSELEAVVSEDASWRQIRVTTDTENKQFEEAFTYFVTEIEPKLKPYLFELQKKLVAHPNVHQLPEEQYMPYLRSVKNAIELYREENIPLQAEINLLAQQYGILSGKMSVEINGKEYTLQQAARFLHDTDRSVRETAFKKITQRRLQDKNQLNELFDQLLKLRHQVALNAGFENYRDYKFRELGRFDYTIDDCFAFHQAVREHILPLQKMLLERKQRSLKLDELRPWDTEATPEGEQPLEPFENGNELIKKSIDTFEALDPFFAGCIRTMQQMNRLDLDSRKGKAPGGYNCPLAETGVPFIFMNSAGTINDLITMMHEGGHAFHSFLSHDLPLSSFKEYPMEMAELASMSMELFTMEYWNHFFPDEEDLRRAKYEELDRVIGVMPWIATIDKFQHWLYTHPGHSIEERESAWMSILDDFSSGMVNWSGLEEVRSHQWQKQLHLFEVPFYYIEYGIAQLGAVAMWQQYRDNPKQAVENYKKALQLGYTKSLKDLYRTAGIRFDLSPEYIKELATFLEKRLAEVAE